MTWTWRKTITTQLLERIIGAAEWNTCVCTKQGGAWATAMGAGTYNWTSLMGSDKKKIFTHLPEKLRGILHDRMVDTVIQVWQVGSNKETMW